MASPPNDTQEWLDDRKIKDPIHDIMPGFSGIVSVIMDTPHFQRLRKIKQLGTTYTVYPGASHNRFEHSLGVAHLARSMALHLRDNQPELNITNRDILCVQVAGLCHDLGHGPWSHVWDGLFIPAARALKHDKGPEWKHEQASQMMFKDMLEHIEIHKLRFRNGREIERLSEKDVRFILALIDGEPHSCDSDEKPFLFHIVANKRNGLDVDKFDYISRDRYMLGIPSFVPSSRIIQNARVIENEICYDIKDVNILHDIYRGRFELHKQHYNHKTAKAIEYMIVDALLLAEPHLKIADKIKDPKKFLHLTDSIEETIKASDDPELEASRAILQAIDHRDLYKCVDDACIDWEHHEIFMEKMTSERIVEESLREAKEQGTDVDRTVLVPSAVIVDASIMHYGMKEKNPLNDVKFYSKRNRNVCACAQKGDYSTLLPQFFAEMKLTVFTKTPEYIGVVQAGYRAVSRAIFEDLERPSTPKRTTSAQAFIERVLKAQGPSLDAVLQPSLEDEAELRRFFATDKSNARLANPYVGLVDVFAAPDAIRTTRARVVTGEDDLDAKYVMPLSETNRRKDGTPSMVPTLDEFKKNWGVFSEGSLSQLVDWNNVVAAGGAVLACLTPLSEQAKASKRAMRKYYHSAAYPTSDVDLFLWGMTPEQAEAKIVQIYEAVRDSVPWDVTCVRTKHTVSIHSQYPYRSVQIVLRLYSSPAEIMAGFDIDAPCCLYNGERVYANPRAIVAMMRQCNTVDMTRRSPSYEVRLAKYSGRAYEVYVPTLSRKAIDPTIYERSIARITGLARLLVLEKLTDTDTRFSFLESRRNLRGRPNPLSRYNRRNKRKYKGDLKADTSLSGMEMNDYDVASLHIPYGPGWDARRIDKLIYQTDLGMNSTFNPKNKGRRLHRHPAFFGQIEEVLEDCCEHCPDPVDEDERKLEADESDQYIKGRITFVEEDPGRQSISGSFNPIDVGEWSEQVYIGATEKFFAAIAAGDRATVAKLLEEGHDINRRDHVGRLPLHVAIFCRQTEIACQLIDAGARMTWRLVDGRTSLHLAAQMDLLVVVNKLLERSAINREKAGKPEDSEEEDQVEVGKEERVRLSSEDDWTSEEDDMAMSDEDDADSEGSEEVKTKKAVAGDEQSEQPNVGDLPEEELDVPDVFDVNLPDWDLTYSPLAFAIVFGSLPIVEALLAAGADAKHPMQAKASNTAVLPLTLTIVGEDDDRTCKIAERLIEAGASCTAMESEGDGRTVFCRAVEANRANLVATFMRCDPNANVALNFPLVGWTGAITPLILAVNAGYYSTVAALLAHGAKLDLTQEEVERAFANNKRLNYITEKSGNSTIEAALLRNDDIVRLFTELGAETNTGVKQAMQRNSRPEIRRTFLDWVRYAISWCDERIAEFELKINPPTSDSVNATGSSSPWAAHLAKVIADSKAKLAASITNRSDKTEPYEVQRQKKWKDIKGYMVDTEAFLVEHGAKTWSEVFPTNVTTASEAQQPVGLFGTSMAFSAPSSTFGDGGLSAALLAKQAEKAAAAKGPTGPRFNLLTGNWNGDFVPSYLESLYDELFEACFAGNNARVQEMCLPAKAPAKDSNLPLQIAVAVADESGNQYVRTGYTPLYAAIAARRWDTARLIVTIAAAQYKPAEEKKKFVLDVDSDEDSDNDNDSEGYDSDGTVEQEAINFVDIASRPSQIQCKASPQDLLQSGNMSVEPFTKAIHDDDYEAFVNVFRLYKHSPIPAELPTTLLAIIVSQDRPDMLDEFIRRTGQGIKVEAPKTAEEELAPVINDKNKLYLGLNVQGKKRMDLAKRNDPNADNEQEQEEPPLVWKAIQSGALKVLDYLLGSRPLEAYQYYASTVNSDSARLLKRTPDLEKVLPEWLGLTITPLGESPLTAALLSYKKVDNLKYLFQKLPKLMAAALKEPIKFLGINPLGIAVQLKSDKAVVDFLLARDVSPAERDQNRGWNIFHYACNNVQTPNLYGGTSTPSDLLEHLLKKLPRDVVEALLSQQSKDRLNTPLHVAVKRGNRYAVKAILDFSKDTALVRNAEGSIPLHCAARPGFPEIVELLLAAAPEGVEMENGVGETPLEMAALQQVVSRNQILQGNFNNQNSLAHPMDNPPRIETDKLEVELPRLRKMLAKLSESGVLQSGTELFNKFASFADFMEGKLAEAKPALAASAAVNPSAESANNNKTHKILETASAARDGRRQLVHLLDVQGSVQRSLAEMRTPKDRISELVGNNNYYSYSRRRHMSSRKTDEEGLEEEEDPDAPYLRSSLIFRNLLLGPDTL
ncbi:Ankyrin repeat protein [Mycena kentingensis (nom. inval.)]|nr:Ankyrin repeat protein [Mycena kentingensis (nom. inval.)]